MSSHLQRSIGIRASDLQWWAKCSRRTWLDHNGNHNLREEIKPFVAFQYSQGDEHEDAVQEATAPNARPVVVRNWRHGVELTKDAIAQGISMMQAYLEAEISFADVSRPVRIYGKLDQLLHPRDLPKIVPRRKGLKSLLGARPTPYIPVEIKRYTEITLGDELQLDCYNWLIEQTTGICPPTSYFYLSKDAFNKPRPVEHQYDSDRLLTTLHEIALFVDHATAEPDVNLNPHCRRCHWYQVCINVAQDNMSVDLLSRVPYATKAVLKNEGIGKLDQFMQLTEQQLTQFKGIKTTAPRLLAQAKALVEKKPVWLGTIAPQHQQGGWMFDIETNPKTQELWGIGWRDPYAQMGCIVVGPRDTEFITDEGTKVQIVTSVEAAWDFFVQHVLNDSLPLYHWSPYDASRFRREALEVTQERLGSRMSDLARLVGNSVRLPVISDSLKDVAPYIGFEWIGYVSFLKAWRDYQMAIPRFYEHKSCL